MDYDRLKANANIIVKKLIKKYGNEIPIFLNYHKNKPYEFLFAVIMSAQCTDKMVNEVTKNLFKKYDTLDKFANTKLENLEKDIHKVGFFHNKAKNIKATAIMLRDKFNGKVPENMNDLIKLPGVGRKTANVVLGHLYNVQGMAVDTHVKRVSTKLFGLNKKNNVKYIEEELLKIIPKKYCVLWNTHIIMFGRGICTSRKPNCDKCMFSDICAQKCNESNKL